MFGKGFLRLLFVARMGYGASWEKQFGAFGAINGFGYYVGSKAADKLAVDDAVTIKWVEDKVATFHTATLYNEAGETIETSSVKAAQAVFTPSMAGKNTTCESL